MDWPGVVPWLTEYTAKQWVAGEQYVARSRYLGSGTYRSVFLVERGFQSTSDEVIFKSMKILPSNDGRHTLEERAGKWAMH